ncbi:Hypothetical protein SMAX5B_021997 [Scophthalmus maximus]|uniref:Uncharacterized protein n=1 Tax=Scophthalmus maximus TaxID=52904 RepID=A0A2U9CKP7_SCOMX|nr:Hypothetical protein SMAX5B_021997 [Scophthalmus maximus]
MHVGEDNTQSQITVIDKYTKQHGPACFQIHGMCEQCTRVWDIRLDPETIEACSKTWLFIFGERGSRDKEEVGDVVFWAAAGDSSFITQLLLP